MTEFQVWLREANACAAGMDYVASMDGDFEACLREAVTRFPSWVEWLLEALNFNTSSDVCLSPACKFQSCKRFQRLAGRFLRREATARGWIAPRNGAAMDMIDRINASIKRPYLPPSVDGYTFYSNFGNTLVMDPANTVLTSDSIKTRVSTNMNISADDVLVMPFDPSGGGSVKWASYVRNKEQTDGHR